MNKRRGRFGTLVLGLSLLFAGGVPGMAGAALKTGDALPAFNLQTVDGKAVSNQSFVDSKVGVLYLFKSSKCDPCMRGLDQLAGVSRDFGSDVVVVGVGKEDQGTVAQAVTGHNVGFQVGTGGDELFKSLSAAILPTTVLIGPGGLVLKSVPGGGDHVATMIAAIAEGQLQRQQPQAARKLFLKATKEGKTVSMVAKAGIAYSYLKENNLGDAEKEFQAMASSGEQGLALQGKEGLAEVYYKQGRTADAIKLAEEVLKVSPNRTMANLVKAKGLYAEGKPAEAEKSLTVAAADDSSSDFAWQKSEANLALGNLQVKGKEPQLALKSYRRASTSNPYSAEALSNEGVALKDVGGDPEKAMEVFKKLQNVDPQDKLVHSLLRQAQAAIAQKQDLERQKYIDGLVGDLVKQFREGQKQAKPPLDDWTSPPIAVSILGFANDTQGMLMGRIGLEGILQDELLRQLQERNIKVVERAIMDKLLQELKLGSSELADPDTALKLGRIMAARLIATGSMFTAGKSKTVSLRVVDTETTNIVASAADENPQDIDPTKVAAKFADSIAKTISEQYPLKGRIAMVEGDSIIINLGKKHGVKVGQQFNVMGEGQPIELNGRVLGYKPSKLGSLEVTKLDDGEGLMAYAKVVEKSGEWAQNQKIIQKQ